jgi:hypothetical protein
MEQADKKGPVSLPINSFFSGGGGNISIKSNGYMIRVARVSCILQSVHKAIISGEIKEMSIVEEALEVWKVGEPSLFNRVAPTPTNHYSRIYPLSFSMVQPHNELQALDAADVEDVLVYTVFYRVD